MIMRRLLFSTGNIFLSLILGAIAFGFVFLKYPDTMNQILDAASGMVLALTSHVVHDPGQVAFAEGDHAVAGLPRERAVAAPAVVDGVGARALEVADPFGDLDGRRQADGHVGVVFDAADGVDDGSGGFEGAVDEVFVGQRLDHGGEHRGAVLRAPDEVVIEFPIDVAGHGGSIPA